MSPDVHIAPPPRVHGPRFRRIVVLGTILGVAALVAGVLIYVGDRRDAPDRADYRVDVVFDAARGIREGMVVKIAGARAGTVKDVHLTRDYKARVEMNVDKRFGPFRADAYCAIKPEGLISENFVGCEPGTASSGTLKQDESGMPTVPVEQTAAPVSLQDLFQIFNVPTTQRLSVLINELGIGVAARGSDINDILYRANPTLAAARKAITVVNRQRAQLVELLDASAPVIGRLAQRSPDVQRFIEQTARLATTTASRRDALAEAIRRLPPTLRAARPALQRLGDVAEAAPPTLRALRTAAPSLTRLTADLPAFSRSGVSALNALTPQMRRTRATLINAAPVLRLAGRAVASVDPAGRDLMRFLVDVRDEGGSEFLLKLYYFVAGATNRFDAESHLLIFSGNLNACAQYAVTPLASCDGHMDGKRGQATVERSAPAAQSEPARAAVAGEHAGLANTEVLDYLLK